MPHSSRHPIKTPDPKEITTLARSCFAVAYSSVYKCAFLFHFLHIWFREPLLISFIWFIHQVLSTYYSRHDYLSAGI